MPIACLGRDPTRMQLVVDCVDLQVSDDDLFIEDIRRTPYLCMSYGIFFQFLPFHCYDDRGAAQREYKIRRALIPRTFINILWWRFMSSSGRLPADDESILQSAPFSCHLRLSCVHQPIRYNTGSDESGRSYRVRCARTAFITRSDICAGSRHLHKHELLRCFTQ